MGFFNIHSVAKYERMKGGPFGDIKNVSKSLTKPKKGKSQCRKKWKVDPSALEWILFHVRGFGCVQNEVLSNYGKSA